MISSSSLSTISSILFFMTTCLYGEIGMLRFQHRHRGTKENFLQYITNTI